MTIENTTLQDISTNLTQQVQELQRNIADSDEEKIAASADAIETTAQALAQYIADVATSPGVFP